MPAVLKVLNEISSGRSQLAFSSHDGASFAMLTKTHLDARGIIRRIESPGEKDRLYGRGPGNLPTSPILNDDELLVIEVGEDFADRKLGKATTWLQHHP